MPIAPQIPQCHHVRTSGIRCGSPSMRNRSLCYYHTRVSTRPPARTTEMPLLEDGNAIQLGIANIIRRVLMCDLEYRAAYVLLHAYKLALINLKNVHPAYYKDVITVDPATDPDNAGALTEPCTFEQIEESTDDLTEVTPQAAALVVSEQIAGAPSNRPSFGRLGGIDHMSQPGHDELTDQQLDDMVMRGAGNHAYFMPDTADTPPSAAEDAKVMKDLFALAGSLRKDVAG